MLKLQFWRSYTYLKYKRKSLTAVRCLAQKLWVLFVLATLWGAAYTLLMFSRAPQEVNLILVSATTVLGLGWLYKNLKVSVIE